MRRLIIMRHAHAPTDEEVDFDRRLSSKGKKQAEIASKFLLAYKIEKIIYSHAPRVVDTLKIMLNQITIPCQEMLSGLYSASEKDIINLIFQQEDNINTLMILGHNPVIYSTILTLVVPEDVVKLPSAMGSANIVILDFHNFTNWNNVFSQKAIIENSFSPNV